MKKLLVLLLFVVCSSCLKEKRLDITSFRTGSFEIPANEKYGKTTFKRIEGLQIETYNDRVDTLAIHWENNFNYTLQMLHPKTELDNETIYVKITGFTKDSYTFEAIIGHSNYIQKGEVFKTGE